MREGANDSGIPGKPREAAFDAARTPDDVAGHRERLSDLESSWRSISGLLESTEAQAGRSETRSLHVRLDELDGRIKSDEGLPGNTESDSIGTARIFDEFAELRADLDGFATRFCDTLECIPRASLEAHFCSEDAGTRRGFQGLIDFILDRDKDLHRHGASFEILVTLLSTAEKGGARRVVFDPATITPRLKAASDAMGSDSRHDLAAIEREFLEAARSWEHSPSEETRRMLQARRVEIGSAILAPTILRAVVFFNAAAWIWRPTSVDGTPETAVRPVESSMFPTESLDRASDSESTDDEKSNSSNAPPPASTSEVRWRIEPQPNEVMPVVADEPLHADRRRFGRIAMLSVCVAGTLFLAASTQWTRSDENIRVLSDLDLNGYSAYLASGYRDGLGTGPLFVGTVNRDWKQLSEGDRAIAADEMRSRFQGFGLREAMVYDENLRMVLHFTEGSTLPVLR